VISVHTTDDDGEWACWDACSDGRTVSRGCGLSLHFDISAPRAVGVGGVGVRSPANSMSRENRYGKHRVLRIGAV